MTRPASFSPEDPFEVSPGDRTDDGSDDGLDGADVIRPRVLVADDSEIIREGLGQLLLASGYDVEAVADGAAAVRALKTGRIDALLLDLQMPRHDGFETLQYVQEHRQSLPTILLSGLPAEEIQHRMHKLDSHALPPLFLKPCDYDQLLGVLELMLAGELPTSVE